jgi:transketolase
MGAPELLDQLEIWSVGTLPLEDLPAELSAAILDKRRVITIEEHYRSCGLGEALSHLLLTSGVLPKSLTCLHAAGYPSGRYGSQRWHQEESALRGPSLVSRLKKALRD